MHGSIIAVGDYPEGSATASRLRLLAKAISAGGVGITVAIIHPTLKQPIEANARARGRDGDVEFVFLTGRTVRPRGTIRAALDTVHGMIRSVGFVWRQKKSDARFLLLYTPYMTKFAPLLLTAWLLRLPVFFEICEISATLTAHQRLPLRTRFVIAADKLIEYIAPRFGRGIIPISDAIERHLAARGATAEQMLQVPILVDVDQYSSVSRAAVAALDGRRFFFNSGFFLEKDGVDYVVRAFERAAAVDDEVLLAFSGMADEETRARVTGYLSSPALAERIVFTGFLSRQELIWCYQNSQALLSCRSNSPYANFGFPTKLAEYLAAGTVVIATRVGDTTRYLTHDGNARLADPEDSHDIAAQMLWVLSHPERARELGLRGRDAARQYFDYRAHAETLAGFLRSRTSNRDA